MDVSSLKFEGIETWGPDPDFIIEKFKFLPFNPFSRTDKINKCCDFANQNFRGGGTLAKEDEDNFRTVESKHAFKSKNTGFKTKKQIAAKQQNLQANTATYQRPTNYSNKNNKNKGFKYPTKSLISRPRFKDLSSIQPSWDQKFEMQVLSGESAVKQYGEAIMKKEEISKYGVLREYDPKIEMKAHPKLGVPLTLANVELPYLVTEDEVYGQIRNRFEEYFRSLDSKAQTTVPYQIYISDVYLSLILTAKISSYPWALNISKKGKVIIFEAQELPNTKITLAEVETINEMSNLPLPEDEKEYLKLCHEAAGLSQTFQKNSVIYGTEFPGIEKHPNDEEEGPSHNLYIYNKWSMTSRQQLIYEIYVRSEINSCIKNHNGKNVYAIQKSLNEFDFSTNLRQRLETTKGATLGEEIRNNSSKAAKWYCQMVLGGADILKLAYISRINQKDKTKQEVLHVESMDRKELNQYLSFHIDSAWTAFKNVLDYLIKEEKDGDYVLTKVAYRNTMRLYEVKSNEPVSDHSDQKKLLFFICSMYYSICITMQILKK